LSQTFEVDDERMADLRMNEIFIIDVIDLLSFDNFTLVEQFEGNILSGFFVFGNLDFTESSLTQDSSDFIVF